MKEEMNQTGLTAEESENEKFDRDVRFAESVLTLIGKEDDMPESEQISDLVQIRKDGQIIESALEQGYKVDTPVTIRHFAKFRNKELAGMYASRAKENNLAVHSVGHIASTGQYQMRLTHDTAWNQLKISTATVFLRRLAADFQGEYQGWTLNE